MLELEHVELVVGIHHELAVSFPNEFPGICWQHDEVLADQHLSSHDYQYAYTCMYVFRVVFAGLYVANWSGPLCLFRHFQTNCRAACGNMMKCRLVGAIVSLPASPHTYPGILWQPDEVRASQHLASHAYQYAYTCMCVVSIVCAGFYVADWSGQSCLFRHFQTNFQEFGGRLYVRLIDLGHLFARPSVTQEKFELYMIQLDLNHVGIGSCRTSCWHTPRTCSVISKRISRNRLTTG